MAISNLQVQRSHLRAIWIARIEGTRKARDVATRTAIQDGCHKELSPKALILVRVRARPMKLL